MAERRGKDAKKLNYAGHYLDDVSFTVETWTATVSVTMERDTNE
jgi:hypothetical protein